MNGILVEAQAKPYDILLFSCAHLIDYLTVTHGGDDLSDGTGSCVVDVPGGVCLGGYIPSKTAWVVSMIPVQHANLETRRRKRRKSLMGTGWGDDMITYLEYIHITQIIQGYADIQV